MIAGEVQRAYLFVVHSMVMMMLMMTMIIMSLIMKDYNARIDPNRDHVTLLLSILYTKKHTTGVDKPLKSNEKKDCKREIKLPERKPRVSKNFYILWRMAVNPGKVLNFSNYYV